MYKDYTIRMDPVYEDLFLPYTYKVYSSGRNAGKSYAIASVLSIMGAMKPLKILCVRETQKSLKDSVYSMVCARIKELGYEDVFYKIFSNEIRGIHKLNKGTRFIFTGLKDDADSIRSMNDVNITWIEEGQHITSKSWRSLLRTVIRNKGIQIFISMNPRYDTDILYKTFIENEPPPDTLVKKVSWRNNPDLSPEALADMIHLKQTDYETYLSDYEGHLVHNANAQIFKNFEIDHEDEVPSFIPPGCVPLYGCDWGFSPDPTALVKCYTWGRNLYIAEEAYAYGVTGSDLSVVFERISDIRDYDITCDNNRPEHIEELRRKGFRTKKARKPRTGHKTAMEMRIDHIKDFRVYINPACEKIIEEFHKFSYKIDKHDETIVLPEVDDSSGNGHHGIDALGMSIEHMMNIRPQLMPAITNDVMPFQII